MNITTAGILSASLVIGVGGAVAVFDAATSSEPRTAAVESPATVDDRGDRERFAPCEKPAKLVGGECVTDVTKTVVVPPAPKDDKIYGRTRVLGDDTEEVVDNYDDDYDGDHGTRTRTRTRTHGQSVDTSTGTGHGDGGGTSTRTRTGH